MHPYSSRTRKILLSLPLLLLGAACNEASLSDAGVQKEKTTEGSGEAGATETAKESTAIPPVAIGGAYLYLKCAREMSPTDTVFEALVGCRLEDQNGARKPASNFAEDYAFRWRLENASDFLGAVKMLPDDQRYDAVLLFKSISLASLEESMKSVQIVFYTDVSQNPREQIRGTLPEISVPADSILEQASYDYKEIGDELEGLLTSGEPTPPIP